MVDKDRRRSRFATSLPAVQEIIEHIGGIHNLHLARLATAKKCLLVEGKDVEILRHLQNVIRPNSPLPFDVIPHISLGGWGGFHHAVGIARLLRDTGEERLRIYCIFDRDYRDPSELANRVERAKEEGIDMHIWRRKEIENYLGDGLDFEVETVLEPPVRKAAGDLFARDLDHDRATTGETLHDDVPALQHDDLHPSVSSLLVRSSPTCQLPAPEIFRARHRARHQQVLTFAATTRQRGRWWR